MMRFGKAGLGDPDPRNPPVKDPPDSPPPAEDPLTKNPPLTILSKDMIQRRRAPEYRSEVERVPAHTAMADSGGAPTQQSYPIGGASFVGK